jgi:hypothetical protein
MCENDCFYLQGYNAVKFVARQQIFRRNVSLSVSESKNKPSMCIACYLLVACFLLRLFFDPAEGEDRFLRNIHLYSADSFKRRAETCFQNDGAHLCDVIFKT